MSIVGVTKMDGQEMVTDFYKALRSRPVNPSEALYLLREELEELEDSINLDAIPTEQLKEMADVVYTLYGYAISKGWDLDKAFELVHESNMSKEFTVDGKVAKGAGYVPPDLSECVI